MSNFLNNFFVYVVVLLFCAGAVALTIVPPAICVALSHSGVCWFLLLATVPTALIGIAKIADPRLRSLNTK